MSTIIKFSSQKKIGLISVVIFLTVIGLVAFLPHPVWALDLGIVSGIQNAISAALSVLINFLGSLLTILIGLLIRIAAYNDFIYSPVVLKGWVLVRDVANMFFVLVLLVISFGTILQQSQYQAQKLLPKVILMAVLVNFSKVISGWLIDFSQVIMLTFVAAFQSIGAGNFAQALQISKLLSFKPDTSGAAAAASLGPIAVSYLLALLYVVVAFVVVLVLTVMLTVRIVVLWVLIILSPMAYVLSVVPKGQEYAGQWWSALTKQLIFGPVMAFFLWLSLASFPTIVDQKTKDLINSRPVAGTNAGVNNLAQDPRVGLVESGTPESVFTFIISIAMLMIGLQVASKSGAAGAGFAGKAYGNLTTAGSKVASGAWRMASYLPAEYGKRIGYATASGALGLIGRAPIPLLNDTALLARSRLNAQRDAAAKKSAGAISTMSESDLRVMAQRKNAGSRLQRILPPSMGKLLRAGGRGLQTESGRAIANAVAIQAASKAAITAPLTMKTRQMLEEKQVLENIKKDSPNKELTGDNKKRYDTINAHLLAEKKRYVGNLHERLEVASGHKVDFDDNDLITNKAAWDAQKSLEEQNLDLLPEGIRRTVTHGTFMRGHEISPDLVDYRMIRMKNDAAAKFMSSPRVQGNKEFFNKMMDKVFMERVKDALKDLKAEKGGKPVANDEILAAIRPILQPFVSVKGISGKANRGISDALKRYKGDKSTPPSEGYAKMLSEQPFNVDIVTAQIDRALRGGRVGKKQGGDTEPDTEGESEVAQYGIDPARYAATAALYQKHRGGYVDTPEYKANPGAYLAPKDLHEAREIEALTNNTPHYMEDDYGEHAHFGVDDTIKEYQAAKAKNLRVAETGLTLDTEALDIKGAGLSLNNDNEKDAARLQEYLPKILDQYRERGYGEEKLADLAEALKSAQNVSLVNDDTSVAEQLQTFAHERAEAWTRGLNDAGVNLAEQIRNALSPGEWADVSTRIRDRWGKGLSDEDVAREYFAEGSANETAWGRETGIRFTPEARQIWEQTMGPTQVREALVPPQQDLSAEDIIASLRTGLGDEAQLTPEVVSQLTEAIAALKESVGDLHLGHLGTDISKAITRVAQKDNLSGPQIVGLLSQMVYAAKSSKKSIDELADELDKPTDAPSIEINTPRPSPSTPQ